MYISKGKRKDIQSLTLFVKVAIRNGNEDRAECAQWAINTLLGLDVDHARFMLVRKSSYSEAAEEMVRYWADMGVQS